MKYYAHYGHKEFILCLGHKADLIKNYFVNYDETISNDFIFSNGGKNIQLINSDIHDWTITFVDTGIHSNIGMRLMVVKEYLKDDEIFLANYADGLTDMHLPSMIDWFTVQKDKTAAFMAYKPTQSFHIVQREPDGKVNSIDHIGNAGIYINTGYFILRKEIFDYMQWGDELVVEPFRKLIENRRLTSYNHEGFWASMDTYKDKQTLDDYYSKGKVPWEVWRKNQL